MKRGKEVFQNKICQAKGHGSSPPARLLEPRSNTDSARQSFQLPKLSHNFSSAKTTPRAVVIKLVLWECKISFRGNMVNLVKPMTNSGTIPINNENRTLV